MGLVYIIYRYVVMRRVLLLVTGLAALEVGYRSFVAHVECEQGSWNSATFAFLLSCETRDVLRKPSAPGRRVRLKLAVIALRMT